MRQICAWSEHTKQRLKMCTRHWPSSSRTIQSARMRGRRGNQVGIFPRTTSQLQPKAMRVRVVHHPDTVEAQLPLGHRNSQVIACGIGGRSTKAWPRHDHSNHLPINPVLIHRLPAWLVDTRSPVDFSRRPVSRLASRLARAGQRERRSATSGVASVCTAPRQSHHHMPAA